MAGDEDKPADNSINLQRGGGNDSAPQLDTATYVAGQIFGSAALPSWMPEFLKRKIEAEAETAQRNPDTGVMTIDSQFERNRKSRTEREAEELEQLRDKVAIIADQQQREREEWSKKLSTVGGVTMSGEQWADLSKRLREDEKFREQVIDAFKARGMSEDEATARADRAADVADAASVPPSQRNDKQKKAIADAEADPTFRSDMRTITAVLDGDKPKHSLTANRFNDAAEGAQTSQDNRQQPTTVTTPKVVLADGPGF